MAEVNISEKQLHTNYIKLAKIIHPDHNSNDPLADVKFQELQQQYEKAQKLIESKPQYQASVSISLKESILGCERYFVNDDNYKFVLNIPAGVKNKQTILYRDLNINSVKNTILHIKILIDLPKDYTISGDTLILKTSVHFWKLYFGGEYKIKTPDGLQIPVLIPKKTKSGKMFRILKYGLWNRAEKKRDPLYVQIFGRFI
jgi:DnaJ-class molecular chaperone